MPAERTERRRQDPVSCENCRTKKLKCDRQHPCANCLSRQWTCHYKCERPPQATPSRNESALRQENRALQARLDRLEKAVFGQQSPQDSLEPTATAPKESPQDSTPERRFQDEKDTVTNWLEAACLSMTDAIPHISDQFQLKHCTADQLITESEHLVKKRSLLMPSHEMALHVLQLYETFEHAAHLIMHVPSVRNQMNAVYSQGSNTSLKTSGIGIVALILAISADIGFWDARRGYIFGDTDSAVKASTVLAKQALEAVDHARRCCAVSIEIVQANVLLTFLFYHLEGFSSRTRELHTSALLMARDLELHRIDDPRSKRKEPCVSREDMIQHEVSRKIWWHITSTDWLLAFIGGPHEGVYSSHPRHMTVNMPRNLNHDDLLLQDAKFSRPESEATNTTYFLLRVKLAVLCREVVDTCYHLEPEDVPYDSVIELDNKFEALVHSFPRVLHLDMPVEIIKQELGDAYDPALALQRAMANLMTYSRRCKLHLPYITRAKHNPRYMFSRQMGLESARRVLLTRRVFIEETTGALAAFMHLGGILHHVFYAALILVMDVCLNANHTHEELLDVREALSIVEDAKDGDRIASRFLESLSEMIKRHQIKLPTSGNSALALRSPTTHLLSPAQVTPLPPMTEVAVPVNNIDQLFGVSDFEDVWQDFMGDAPYLDPQSWDSLVSDLEMRLI